ncbi:beta-1,3-galactosyl-O-glycosyl-glycoprotein beta-1,6-N-acetylglucosaminyltransferase-like [Saccostrea echinata]|uniref:beta-1,3-galactosyl-O-glycosyl-glycoprotein beta-1,6-N-acetylglucosaminyltransferase-like n=1 Tax=Saccostrea echinata TaxID=191078 RepID=UPI002A82EF65|nr:beta-1,3-galactosyl-O-glycosyl-glycoprotein beta-1,6-N-acetylglucosaminyltransferase-like [Saccostrea echinata]
MKHNFWEYSRNIFENTKVSSHTGFSGDVKKTGEKTNEKTLLKLFDIGPQFSVSYSPLYRETIPDLSTAIIKHVPEALNKQRDVHGVSCRLLFEGNIDEIQKSVRLKKSQKSDSIRNQTRDCQKFVKTRGYINDTLSEEEMMFPIAYSIMAYKSPEQFEILLRAIYRPQNIYCVHIDNKTSDVIFEDFSSITRCFQNVFLASERISVQWGGKSVLTQELVCMKDLLRFKKWKYLINLTGQEFPLRTNSELVRILKIFNGSNESEGILKRANKDRWANAGQPPHKIRPIKGAVHVTVNRNFVEYSINNHVGKDFLAWVQKAGTVPDETFFASLIHNPHLGIPGSFKGQVETDYSLKKPFLSRFKSWRDAPNYWPCHGHFVRGICIFGLGDLPLLARRPEFFANKFHIDYQPHILLCLDQLLFNRTRDEYFGRLQFETDYYENLEYIKNVV